MQFKQAGKFIIDKLNRELPATLFYHCIDHTLDVYSAAEMIGKQEQISDNDMKLLLTAAWYHDSGFIKCPKGHEEESCLIAAITLPDFDYSLNEITMICDIIMATRIPQSPKTHLAEILADADLDYLGRDDFFTTGDKLFKELLTFGIVKNEEEWNRLQIRFMENHHYFTKTSVNLRVTKKEQHLRMVKAKLKN